MMICAKCGNKPEPAAYSVYCPDCDGVLWDAIEAKEKAEGALERAYHDLGQRTEALVLKEAEVARLREDRSERIAGARAIEILRKENDRIGEAGRGAIIAVEERLRQKSVEGWTPAHDAQHEDQELAVVAACYAANGTYAPHIDWPETWDRGWDKRKKHNRERQLAIAAALCMAEIDRLARRRAGREGK